MTSLEKSKITQASVKHMNTRTPTPYENTPTDEVDLHKLVSALWRQRKLIATFGVVGGIVGLALSLTTTQYVSSGLFQIQIERNAKQEKIESVSNSNYKRYENVLLNPQNLEHFVGQRTTPSEPGASEVLELARSPKKLREAISPEFSLTEKEQRNLGIKIPTEDGNLLLGFRVHYSSKEPSQGTVLKILGEYLRDSLIALDLRSYAETQCAQQEFRASELRNEQLKAQFLIEQEEERMKSLRRLIEKNPTAAAIDTRQVISLENNGARFLTPGAHLNAAEIGVTDMKLGQKEREREMIAISIKKSYYCEGVKLLTQPAAAAAILDQFEKLQLAAVKNHDSNLPIVEQTSNEIKLELIKWRDTYLRAMRYAVAPENLEIRERKFGRLLGLLGGGLLGGFLGLMAALLWSWWQSNRDAILVDAKSS